MTSLTIQRLSWSHPDATALRAAQQREIDSLRPLGPGVPANAANVPLFLIAYDGAEPVACGGLRPLAEQGLPGQAEVKRMYVLPSRRGSGDKEAGGVAVVILRALEEVAKEYGWVILKVETAVKMMQARRFYEKHGYVGCEVFGAYEGNEHAVCYEKSLV